MSGVADALAITVETIADPDLAADLSRRLDAAHPVGVGRAATPLAVVARDERGDLVGGLVAEAAWGWLHVELLWVGERRRGRGVGTRLVAAAEERARELGCTRAYVSTLAWQAPDFYRRLGYRTIAELPEFVAGQPRFWLAKELGPDQPAAGALLTHRIRAASLVFRDDRLLLVEHRDRALGRQWWSPPGGGVVGNESITACAEREALEETGLRVRIGKLAYVQDLLVPYLGYRTAEFFFLAEAVAGEPRPERPPAGEALRAAFLSRMEIGNSTVLPHFLADRLWSDRVGGFSTVGWFRDTASA